MEQTPKVFISYSWSTPSHQDWVINLAERLVSDGIHVKIDKWDLKEGQDKYDFMESMVKSNDINKVLIILDRKYAEKAEQRAGGVGTETQIISPTIYGNVSQEKFIPIVAEVDEDGNPFIPIYLNGRIYINLSEEDTFEENYEKLIRNVFQRPIYNRPQLGKAPSYLFEDTLVTHKTTTILRSFENQINKNPKRVNSIIQGFLEEFFENLKDFEVSLQRDAITMGKSIHDKLNQYLPLRNDLVYFIERVTKEDITFDIDIVIRFLERLNLLQRPLDERGSWSQLQFEAFRFAIHEIFLYLIAIGLKNRNFTFIEELLHTHYFFQDKYETKKDPESFSSFHNYVEAFDSFYKQTFSKNFYSPMADFLIKRIPIGFTKENIIEADLLCHYVANLNNGSWFPITYVYKGRGSFELFNRMTSTKHFEKVKGIFGIKTANELKEKLITMERNRADRGRIGYSDAFDQVLPLYKMINTDTLATTR